MVLEERSGHKKLLKLLLEKQVEILTETKANTTKIEQLRHDVDHSQMILNGIVSQLELISGIEDFNKSGD